MIDNNKIILPDSIDVTLSKTTMCLNTFFLSKLIDDEYEAYEWLEISLKRNDFLTHSGHILIEELLLPINLSNQHWILGTIDVKHHCYYAINPYNPLLPTTFELSIASFITEALSRKFNLQVQKFTDRSPNNVHNLPIQLPNDTINCGVYVSMYLVICIWYLSTTLHWKPPYTKNNK